MGTFKLSDLDFANVQNFTKIIQFAAWENTSTSSNEKSTDYSLWKAINSLKRYHSFNVNMVIFQVILQKMFTISCSILPKTYRNVTVKIKKKKIGSVVYKLQTNNPTNK